MRQLITRIDDELHARIKRQAAAEGKSVNTLVRDILVQEVAEDERGRLRARAGDRIVHPPLPRRVPTMRAVLAATRGSGRAVSEALAAEREER
jgi:plasmid stability protein